MEVTPTVFLKKSNQEMIVFSQNVIRRQPHITSSVTIALTSYESFSACYTGLAFIFFLIFSTLFVLFSNLFFSYLFPFLSFPFFSFLFFPFPSLFLLFPFFQLCSGQRLFCFFYSKFIHPCTHLFHLMRHILSDQPIL